MMVASAQHNISAILTKAVNLRKAVDFYETSLAKVWTTLGERHPEVTCSLRHLAIAKRARANYKDSVSHLPEVLEILKGIPFESYLQEVMIELSHLKRALLKPSLRDNVRRAPK